MHILYLHQFFSPPEGNWISRSLENARLLQKRGHRITMITSSAMFPPEHYRFDSLVNRISIEGIDLVVLKVPYRLAMSYRQRIASFLQFMTLASTIGTPERPDVVFATSTPLTIAVPGILQRWRHRVPMVFEVRDLWPEMPVAAGVLRNPLAIAAARLLERAAYNQSSYIIACSPGMKDGIAKSGFPAERIEVVPNASDLDTYDVDPRAGEAYRRGLGELGTRPWLVYTGTLNFMNHTDYLVHIAARWKERGFDGAVLLYGDGVMLEENRRLAAELGVLDSHIYFMPRIAKTEIPVILNAATMACSTVQPIIEEWDNSANKFFEALAAGKPVFLNYGGWQMELLHQHQAGLAVPLPTPVAEAADELQKALSNSTQLKKWGHNARKLAETHFDRRMLVDRLEQVLHKAIQAT